MREIEMHLTVKRTVDTDEEDKKVVEIETKRGTEYSQTAGESVTGAVEEAIDEFVTALSDMDGVTEVTLQSSIARIPEDQRNA